MNNQADVNYWKSDECAQAFWDQKVGKPYLNLLQDTLSYMQPQAGEEWIDLGCGSGQLSLAIWGSTQGRVRKITALDCAPINESIISKAGRKLNPPLQQENWQFGLHDLSLGLPQFTTNSVDGIVSGLAISYAESKDTQTGQYTDQAYNHLLSDAFRVLKSGGRFVFSVNVPNPRFWKIFTGSISSTLRAAHLRRVMWNGVKMLKYGRWLRKEASRGRFHFFDISEIKRRLELAGFSDIEYVISYAGQAYVVVGYKHKNAGTIQKAA